MRKSVLISLTLACFLGLVDFVLHPVRAQAQPSLVKWGIYPSILPAAAEVDIALCFQPDGPNPYINEVEGNIHVFAIDQAIGDVTWLDSSVYLQPAVITPVVDTPVSADDYTLSWGAGNHNKILFTYNQSTNKKIPYAEGVCAKAKITTTSTENTLSVMRFQSPFAPSVNLPDVTAVMAQSGTSGRIRYGGSLPATCSPTTGDVYFLTSGSIGLYTCISTNTWVLPVATVTVNTGIASMLVGLSTPNQLILILPSNNSFTLALTGSQCKSTAAATAQTDFLVTVNGTTKATLRFAASATTCTVVSPVSASIVSGDVIKIVGPATPDLTLANIGFNLKVSIP